MLKIQKIRFVVAVLAGILIIIHLFRIDYQNMSWTENKSAYLGIISMSLIMIAMLLSNKESQKK